MGPSQSIHPLETVHEWARTLRAGDVETALMYYAPDAVVHVDGRAVSGRSALSSFLEASDLAGTHLVPDVRGNGATVLATWIDDVMLEVESRTDHGLLVEQWFRVPTGVVEIEEPSATAAIVIRRGDIDEDEIAYAEHRLAGLVSRIDEPVLMWRITLERQPDPALEKPFTVQVSVDIDGDLVRAQSAADHLTTAVDLARDRLADKMEQRRRRWTVGRGRSPESPPGQWRRGDLPAMRRPIYDRPVEDRRLVRHKTFVVDESTVDEAAFELDQLDHDFVLFCDLASGTDAVLYRQDDGAYRLSRLRPLDAPEPSATIDVTIDAGPAPTLDVEQAIEWLNTTDRPFLFFADPHTERGRVVYRRHDGHYGLITPE
jgi:ribosome-associated translation inhibitor RaiA